MPKLLFHPVGYVTEQDVEKIKAAVASEEVKALLKISMATIDLSNEAKADEEANETPQAVAEIVKAAPVETKAAPVVAATPAPAAPTKYLPCKEKLGEFTVQQMIDNGWTKEALLAEGYITVYVEPAPAPPAPPKPPAPPAPPAPPKPPAPPAAAVQIENVPPPAKPAPKAPAAAAQPAKSVTVQETTTDAELEDIIGQLV